MYKVFFFLCLSFVFLPGSLLAVTPLTDEHIESFNVDIIVNTDGSIAVTEKILYNSGGLEKHGIYRDIRTLSSQGKKMSIENISVRDEQGREYAFEKKEQGNTLQLKIGDSRSTFSGVKTYVIAYRATHAVSYFDNFDEIYWNTTGNNWPFPILSATAEVILPSGATLKQKSCYEGVAGSQEPCQFSEEKFISSRILSQGEGMTIATGFDKGLVVEHFTFWERILVFIHSISIVIGGGIAFWGLWSAYRRWYREGRDPKERDVVVPEYDVPDHLTPLEVSGLFSEAQVSMTAFSAQIISLATRGYIRIHQNQDKYVFGLITTNDYELERLPKNDGLKVFDVLFLEELFGSQSTVKLSNLKNTFYQKIPAISQKVLESLKEEGYYRKIREAKSLVFNWRDNLAALVATVLFGMGFCLGSMYIILGSSVALVSWVGFLYFSPQKTERGVRIKEQLEGLKLYIEKAEKARIEFHDAPEKTPELFSSLLPFAMTLGLTKIWLKEFEDLHYANPDWYVATGANNALMTNNFFQDFDNFSQAMSASTAAPGSSGGGFSGGGGGGGGGGSW